MSDQLLARSGYVYCVRRSGKTHYRLDSAPAGQLVNQLKKLAQTEENPTSLVLVGWIEVQDHDLAARTLRETFHLYRLQGHGQDHWFDFRVTRSSELKSLMGCYADLMVKLPVTQTLIVGEPQPQYDRTFRFFETLNAAHHDENGDANGAYFPPDILGVPVFPFPEKHGMSPVLFNLARWTSHWKTVALAVIGLGAIGLGVMNIGFNSIYRTQASQSATSTSTSTSTPTSTPNPLPSSKPSTTPQPKPSTTPQPKPSTPKAQKPSDPDPASIAEPIPNGPKSTIRSDSFEGARLRSNPDDAGSDIDFIPNGTPITLGEASGAWQEIILPDGRRGWVFNDTIQE